MKRLTPVTKPTVYVETSVISYLTNRPSTNAITLGRQLLTQQWWDTRRENYTLLTSKYVTQEIQAGTPEVAERRVQVASEMTMLNCEAYEIEALAQLLIRKKGVPAVAQLDALHIAACAFHSVEYIASWNFTHIVNIHQMQRIQSICEDAGFATINLITLDQLP